MGPVVAEFETDTAEEDHSALGTASKGLPDHPWAALPREVLPGLCAAPPLQTRVHSPLRHCPRRISRVQRPSLKGCSFLQ